MDLLQLREKEIFETLKKIKNLDFVIIGGYAVNAYTLPRFSVDCDIVVKDKEELLKIEKALTDLGYSKEEENKLQTPYHGEFERFEKEVQKDFRVSIDILIKDVLDRQTNSSFSAEWVFKNSSIRILRGKTIADDIKLRIINKDALFVMKFLSCRFSDIRDVFMLADLIEDKNWILGEVSKRYEFSSRMNKIIENISSKQFKDGLQGVFGFVDKRLFEKHKRLLISLGESQKLK